MTLKNSLYKIISFNKEDMSYNLELLPDCLIYRAHFPEQPITPGVCIIQVASELLNDLLESDHELTTVSNAKFLAVINPLETTSVVYTFRKIVSDEETGIVKISVEVSRPGTILSKLSLVYKKK